MKENGTMTKITDQNPGVVDMTLSSMPAFPHHRRPNGGLEAFRRANIPGLHGHGRGNNLAKLKHASLARRRSPLSESTTITTANNATSIPAFYDDVTSSEENGRVATEQPTSQPPPPTHNYSSEEAMHILGVSSTTQQQDTHETTQRIQRLRAIKALCIQSTATATTTTTTIEQERKRLRSLATQIAFHEYNASSLTVATTSTTTAKKPTTPWVPPTAANATSAVSKHKHQYAKMGTRSVLNKDTPPSSSSCHPKPRPRPSAQASALQVKLLTNLYRRLVFGSLRSAERTRWRHWLITRSIEKEQTEVLWRVVEWWRVAALPSVQATAALVRAQRSKLRDIFIAWCGVRDRNKWVHGVLQRVEAGRRKKVMAAVLGRWRWRCAVCRMEVACTHMGERWHAVRDLRRVLGGWRRIAERRGQQRRALMDGVRRPVGGGWTSDTHHDHVVPRSHSERGHPPPQPPSKSDQVLKDMKNDVIQRTAWCRFLASVDRSSWMLAHYNDDDDDDLRESDAMQRNGGVAYDPQRYSSSSSRSTAMHKEKERIEAVRHQLSREAFSVKEDVESLQAAIVALEENATALNARLREVQGAKETSGEAGEATSKALLRLQQTLEQVQEDERRAQEALDAHATSTIEECRRRLEGSLHEAKVAQEAHQEAVAAMQSAEERMQKCEVDITTWRGKVATAASQLKRSSGAGKPAATVKLQEARRRLDADTEVFNKMQHVVVPELKKRVDERALDACEAESTLIRIKEAALQATSRQCTLEKTLRSAMTRVKEVQREVEEQERKVKEIEGRKRKAKEQEGRWMMELRGVRQLLFERTRELGVLQDKEQELGDLYSEIIREERELDLILLADGGEGDSHSDEKNNNTEPLAIATDAVLEAMEPQWPVSSLDYRTSEKTLLMGEEQEDDDDEEEEDDDDTEMSLHKLSHQYYIATLVRRALYSLRHEGQQWREWHATAALCYTLSHLPYAFDAWRMVARDARESEDAVCEDLLLKTAVRRWKCVAAQQVQVRHREQAYAQSREGKLKRECLVYWREYAERKKMRAVQIVQAVHYRHRSLFTAWYVCAQQRIQRRETLDIALERADTRIQSQCFDQWRRNAAARCLLHRVFSSAVSAWSRTLGAAGYELECSAMQQALYAWQIAAHRQREERKAMAMALAADSVCQRRRARHVLTAFEQAVEWKRQKEAYVLPLAASGLAQWRWYVGAYGKGALAERHNRAVLVKKALASWCAAATMTACRVSAFYLKWQIDGRARQALVAWKKAVEQRRRWADVRRDAEAMKRRNKIAVVYHSGLPLFPSLPPPPLEQQQQQQQQYKHDYYGHDDGQADTVEPIGGSSSTTTPTPTRSMPWRVRAEAWRERRELYHTSMAIATGGCQGSV